MRALLLLSVGALTSCSPSGTGTTPQRGSTAATRVHIPSPASKGTDRGNIAATTGFADTKLTQCESLVELINGGVEAVENTGDNPAGGAGAELRELAREMTRMAGELAALEVTVPELRRLAQSYRGMADETAVAARGMAAAVEHGNVEALKSFQKRLERAIQQEDPLVDAINAFCQEPVGAQKTKR